MKRKVGFNFFRPVIINDKEQELLFSFKEIFEKVMSEYQKAKRRIDSGLGPEEYKIIYRYNNEPARLAEVRFDADFQYYHLIFERLDYQLPNRTTLHGESETLDLEDDEWIGLEVNVLYDPENHIFMLQRNRKSLGPSGIEAFLKTIISNYVDRIDGQFSLAMVSDTTAKKRAFKQNSYRKVHLKVTGLKADGIVEKFSKSGNKNVDSVEISFNSSISRNDKIDDKFAQDLLEDFIDDQDVQKLQIRSREKEDSLVEPIDLIDQKLQTFIDFDFGKSRQLNPISAFQEMAEKFNGEIETDGGFKNKVKRMWK